MCVCVCLCVCVFVFVCKRILWNPFSTFHRRLGIPRHFFPQLQAPAGRVKVLFASPLLEAPLSSHRSHAGVVLDDIVAR